MMLTSAPIPLSRQERAVLADKSELLETGASNIHVSALFDFCVPDTHNTPELAIYEMASPEPDGDVT